MSQFEKFNVDYTGSNPLNKVNAEQLVNVKKDQIYHLNHDIFFAETARLYTNVQDVVGSLLIRDIDYIFLDQDNIACDQSGQYCVQSIKFLQDFGTVYIDYQVYGDFVKNSDFDTVLNITNSIVDNLKTDDIEEGQKNFYFTQERVSKSDYARVTDTRLSSIEPNINKVYTDFYAHQYRNASDIEMGHVSIGLAPGQVPTINETGKLDLSIVPTTSTAFDYTQVASYRYYAGLTEIPEGNVICLGGQLDPDDFEDGLVLLKSRVPKNWIDSTTGKVILPNAYDRLLQFDPGIAMGMLQDDAIRNITGYIRGVDGSSSKAYGWGFKPGDNGAFSVQKTYSEYNSYGGVYYMDNGTRADIDASRVVPTAMVNRERTLNAVLCLVCGVLKPVFSTKDYYILKPDKTSTGQVVRLPVTAEGAEGVGYNADSMVAVSTRNLLPTERQGYVMQWNGSEWLEIPDFRGQQAYVIREVALPYYAGGIAQIRQLASVVEITAVGALPDYLTLLPPPAEYPLWDGNTWAIDEMARDLEVKKEHDTIKQLVRKYLDELL